MATLIPALGSCVARMTPGERRTAERLEQKLDADYLLWYDVAVGPKHQHPDFVVMHPRRGILILEVKDFRLSTLIQANKQTWDIHGELGPKTIPNPLEQARQYAHQVVNALERDPQLVQPEGRHQGKLAFPWSYGVVLPNITRAQFDKAELAHAIESHRVICQDEMGEQVEPEALQSRLWDMFPFMMGGVMSLPQMDRVRWIMFPEVRVQVTGELFDDADQNFDEGAELPSIMRVMDLQQEQLGPQPGRRAPRHPRRGRFGQDHAAGLPRRTPGQGQTAASKPILILCYNEPLARQIARVMAAKGIADRVHAVHFHKWCRQQLVAYGQDLPPQNLSWDAFFEDMVQRVISGVDRRQIPSGQYQAVLIDEGHDFAPEWLRLVVQMVDPATNSLLVLYDDAQSIYDRTQKSKNFSFKSVGIQAQGRTTILKINYRNTRQILQTASLVAADLLTAEDKDDDGVPQLKPVSCGRDGEAPLIVRLPTLREEVAQVAELLATAHREGHAWADMAILCRHHSEMDMCAEFLRKRKLPHQLRRNSSSVFDPAHDSIKVMTLHVSKGLEFPVVALVGAGRMPAEGEDEREEARLFYVGATRATQRLVIGASGGGKFAARL